jgi:hypothetical protein
MLQEEQQVLDLVEAQKVDYIESRRLELGLTVK